MRARMAISIANCNVRLREVVLRDKPEEMIAASPKATVPVLVDHAGVVDESLAVMRWALTQSDPECWLASVNDALIETNDGDFKHHLDRYKYSTRYEDADRETHREAGAMFLSALDERLQPHAYLNGDQRSFVDIAIFPFIRQFRIADPAWFDACSYDRVKQWLAGLMKSDLFISVMTKYPAYKETHEEFAFPNQI